jgi:TPR repeat protein
MNESIRVVILGCALWYPLLADFAAGLKAYEEHDYRTAVQEWRPLAEAGDTAAQFNLGTMYLDGQGVPQDETEAVRWFRAAADQGYTKAQRNLGEMYAIGKGVKRDYIQAHMWLNLCAASGNATCADHRDQLVMKMKPKAIAEAKRRASQWVPKKAAEPIEVAEPKAK